LISPLPDLSVVKALQLLGWATACGDILQTQDPTSIHQHFVKVVSVPIFTQYSIPAEFFLLRTALYIYKDSLFDGSCYAY